MKKTSKRLLALLLASVMTVSLAACGGNGNENVNGGQESTPSTSAGDTQETTPVSDVVEEVKSIIGKEYGTDYVSLYEQFGKEVTIADVTEDPNTGFAYIERDGVQYELGLDFLSMAMVYNTSVPAGGSWATADDVYANWWKLYIQRWNYLLPEIPLYANEYYDIYNTAIGGVKEHPTNPYWGPADAVIDWTSSKADKSIILGSSTELSGKFRYAAFGASNPGASDLDIQELTRGLETVCATKEGGYVWNDTVVKSHKETENADGSKTYEIELYDDLKFSDGSQITAKNYLLSLMLFSTPVAAQAAGKDHRSGMQVVGFDAFNAYDGVTGTKEFSGIRLLGDYKFSVTISADYLPYFYDITYASYSANDLKLWIDDADIKDDGNGAYFTDNFYEKNGDKYVKADHVLAASLNTNTDYPYSGAYVVQSYDDSDKSTVLVKNEYFKGNYEGTVPSIEKIVYRRIITQTQLEDFKAGNVDVLAGITGGAETDEAITLADGSNGKYAYIHYSRAGYGKLGFRADYGPAQFTEVRQAIAYCMDRAKFAKDFTGGYGGVTDGPYYTGSWMYQAAVNQGMLLDAYATSVDSAIAVLEKGGWVYDKDGNAYTEGVRYKKISADVISENDKIYKSKDGAYVTTKVGDYYYMPLVLNWYGTSDNPFTDLLVTGLMEDANVAAAGMVVQNTIGDFAPMLDELYQAAVYGYYSGTPMYSLFNFATGFNSAVYDYSYNLTIDPSMYDDYSLYYYKDMADVYWLK
ncbi:MAG: hypothetical protein IJ282_08970 [Lachnospiraceae bacterium]|nr:hypothetical protein [Lachnospiraceae bacterium]